MERIINLDNRLVKEPHGGILDRIHKAIIELAPLADVFVRERGFSRHTAGTQALFKVVGVSDQALWQVRREVFQEIPPTRVKKRITGKGGASKDEVAAALPAFVGEMEYTCDDESDAVAIGVTWVLENMQA